MSLDRWILWFISLFCGIFCLVDLISNVGYSLGVWRLKNHLNKVKKCLITKLPMFIDDTIHLRSDFISDCDKTVRVVLEYGNTSKEFIIKNQWDELKETIIEMRDNDGTATQQEACKFLVNLMEVLEGKEERNV